MNALPFAYLTAGVCVITIATAGTWMYLEDTKIEFSTDPSVRAPSAPTVRHSDPAGEQQLSMESQFEKTAPTAGRQVPDDLPATIQTLRMRGTSQGAIRQIVAEEFSTLFAKKRQAIASRPALTEAARAEQQRLLGGLPDVQQRALSAFLVRHRLTAAPSLERAKEAGRQARSAETTDVMTPDTIPLEAAEIARSNGVVMPAVAASPARETPMTDWQLAEWLKLEHEFLESVGGPNQNPSDPEYFQRWHAAQQRSDAQFRQKFGVSAFLKHNMAAWRNSSE